MAPHSRELYSISWDKAPWKRICVCVCVCVSLEEEMVAHSSILAWEIPWTEESGGLSAHGGEKNLT